MKTSNKFLSGAYILIAFIMTGFLMTVKSNMVKSEPQVLKGNGVSVSENLGELKSNKLILSTEYQYEFDHKSSEIILKGDGNIISELKSCINGGHVNMAEIFYSCGVLERFHNVEVQLPLVLKIGIADYNEIDIYLMDSGTPEANEFTFVFPPKDSIPYKKVNLTIQSKSPSSIEINSSQLVLNTKESVQLSMSGSVSELTVNMDHRSSCDVTKLNVNRAFINGTESKIKFGKLETLSGYFNSGVLSYVGTPDISQLSTVQSEIDKL